MGHFQAVSGSQCFSVYCLMNTQRHFCFVSKLVLLCATEFHLVSGRCYYFGLLSACDAFVMRPAVLVFINSLPLSWNKFFSHTLHVSVLDSLLFDPTNIQKHTLLHF